MKRRIAKALAITFLISMAFTSCELLDDCKTCEPVTNDNGSITTGPGQETCGEDLDRKENENITVGTRTSYYNCY